MYGLRREEIAMLAGVSVIRLIVAGLDVTISHQAQQQIETPILGGR